MKKIITLLLIAVSPGLFAQSHERSVVSSFGGSFSDGSTLSVDHTLGQVVDVTLLSGSIIITQGFQQPFSTQVVSVSEIISSSDIVIFPNPTPGQTVIRIAGLPAGSYLLHLFNVLGQLQLTQSLTADPSGNVLVELDLKQFATGTYYLRVSNTRDIIFTRTIVKNNQ